MCTRADHMLQWYCRTYNQDFLPEGKRLDYMQVPVLGLMLVWLTVVQWVCVSAYGVQVAC